MSAKTIIAAALVVLGIIVLDGSGVNFAPGNSVSFFVTHFKAGGDRFIWPAVGGLALFGGVILLLLNLRRR